MENKKKNGGLYANVKMSVKTADIIILAGIIALALSIVFGVEIAI